MNIAFFKDREHPEDFQTKAGLLEFCHERLITPDKVIYRTKRNLTYLVLLERAKNYYGWKLGKCK